MRPRGGKPELTDAVKPEVGRDARVAAESALLGRAITGVRD
jgi:hypothetical protein